MKTNNGTPIDEKVTATMLLAARQKQINKCEFEINEILKKYDCIFDVALIATSRGNNFSIKITPK